MYVQFKLTVKRYSESPTVSSIHINLPIVFAQMDKASGDLDEDYVVTNLDDGEKYSVHEVTRNINVMKISSPHNDSKPGHSSKVDGKDDDDEEEAVDASRMSYSPLSVPNGGRLTFYRITAVGTTKDADDKVYSVFYLDVRCNIASPNSWFVYRRYSQFRRLSDVLRSEGYVVPVLPSKKLLGGFSLDFIKQRKSDLESWLINLSEVHTNHQSARDPQSHPYYRQFLTADANNPPLPLQRIFPEVVLQSGLPSGKSDDDDDMMLAEPKGGLKDKVKQRLECCSVYIHAIIKQPLLFDVAAALITKER